MNYKKIITIISIILVIVAAVFIAGGDTQSDAERIRLIKEHLNVTYKGEFSLVSDKATVSRDNGISYGYQFETDDDRRIKFTAYYHKGSLVNGEYHITADFDYAIAHYVISGSEFASGDYDITYVNTQEVTDRLYYLASLEQNILKEYGQDWFTPPLYVTLVYRDVAFDYSFSYSSGTEVIYIGLSRNIIAIDEQYEDHDHDHDEHD